MKMVANLFCMRLSFLLEDEDVEKPSRVEPPMVTIVKVDVRRSFVALVAKGMLRCLNWSRWENCWYWQKTIYLSFS
jgi:hypothetical protein